jgi:hypothetical protein
VCPSEGAEVFELSEYNAEKLKIIIVVFYVKNPRFLHPFQQLIKGEKLAQ